MKTSLCYFNYSIKKMQEWKNWCRFCASKEINEIDIFFKSFENSCSIAEDLERLCNLKLESTNDLPSKICNNCNLSIKNLKKFLKIVFRTQKMYVEFVEDYMSDHDQLQDTCQFNSDFVNERNESTQENSITSNEGFDIYIQEGFEDIEALKEAEESLNGTFSNRLENKICPTKSDEIKKTADSDDILKKSRTNKLKIRKDRDEKCTEFQCKICEKLFSNQGGLTVHMKIKHSIMKDPYKCSFCEKTFERKSRLEIHENAHLPSEERKQLSCPHCEKKFNSESGRWSHIHSVHDKKKAVICEECGKEFSTKHHLVKHKISHSQEKNLQCPHCPAKFKAKVGLTAHIEIHGESFPCAICGVLLNTKQLLKKHMIVHSDVKNFKCNFCNKDFKRSKELNYHLITHIGIKPFECRICSQKFVHDMTYRRHLKATHPIQFADMVARGERISSRNFPPPEQLKAINEAAKHT
ncbi:zinc finger protein 493-like isoform X2 [Condylostylus longicornis]|uniref:zinc finger protein 493-like isoform X2 n=1 Tax=Condylostylus longicornis TaxID=2530218 RepID=UPI00244DC5E0|nr:zinc finger protein 493-like isoform X2 [Condylostylus longicornis]